MLYKYTAGSDAMLLEYCDMLNIENQHLYDSNKELSCRVLHLETALETLESRILHVDRRCQEIGLVAFMFFFELLFSYVSSQFPSMFPLLTYSQSFIPLIC